MLETIGNLFLDFQIGRSLKSLTLRIFNKYSHDTYPITPTPKSSRGFRVICKDPYIVFTSERTTEIEVFSKELINNKAYFFVIFASSLVSEPHKIRQLRDCYHKQITLYPNHRIIYLCNTEKERDLIQPFCKDSHFINHNAFLDEQVYRIFKLEKDIDVVYNGRINRSKRHYLIPRKFRISLISNSIINLAKEKHYRNRLRKSLGNAILENFPGGKTLNEIPDNDLSNIPQLTDGEVTLLLNRSKVGLILSAMEGANYASMEYLLCGLPVVSTISIGGRDVFLKNKYCRIVRSTRKAVEKAIQEVMNANYSPEEIRNHTLEQIRPHRERFLAVVDSVLKENDISMTSQTFWDTFFVNKMTGFKPFPEVFREEMQKAVSLKNL